jgi:hypothetical protein
VADKPDEQRVVDKIVKFGIIKIVVERKSKKKHPARGDDSGGRSNNAQIVAA